LAPARTSLFQRKSHARRGQTTSAARSHPTQNFSDRNSAHEAAGVECNVGRTASKVNLWQDAGSLLRMHPLGLTAADAYVIRSHRVGRRTASTVTSRNTPTHIRRTTRCCVTKSTNIRRSSERISAANARGSNPLSSTRFQQVRGIKASNVDSDVIVRVTLVVAASTHAQKSTGNTLPSQRLRRMPWRWSPASPSTTTVPPEPIDPTQLLIAMAHEVAITERADGTNPRLRAQMLELAGLDNTP
jgi:hypothetical protein